ncbi:hypothetical protein [Aliiroseovarius marinus]|uniref:hypothetical protein n=1 Tax=Aliiroseovarius marinus TaxID=2500159 RepID=UPI003D7E278E
MIKQLTCVCAVLSIAGCMSTELSPETEAKIQHLDPEAAQTVGSGEQKINVNISPDGKVALVKGIPGAVTLAELTAAAEKRSGCKGNPPVNIGIPMEATMTSAHYGMFGGAIPILLKC